MRHPMALAFQVYTGTLFLRGEIVKSAQRARLVCRDVALVTAREPLSVGSRQ